MVRSRVWRHAANSRRLLNSAPTRRLPSQKKVGGKARRAGARNAGSAIILRVQRSAVFTEGARLGSGAMTKPCAPLAAPAHTGAWSLF